MFTKQDRDLMSKMLKEQRPTESGDQFQYGAFSEWCLLVRQIANILENRSTKFDRSKFLEECGYHENFTVV